MYRAPREVHEARVYTAHHRLYGLIHLPPALGVADYLNQDRPFFPMTGVLVYAFGLEHPPYWGNSFCPGGFGFLTTFPRPGPSRRFTGRGCTSFAQGDR